MLVNRKISLLSFLILFSTFSKAQTIDYKFQSIFLYNFAKNVEWPSEHQSDDIIIGIVGNGKVAKEMESFFANKLINTKKFVVKSFTSANEINYSHILFIPTSNKNNLSQILEKAGTNSTLIVTEQNGWGKLGSVINFIISDEGKFKFELNREAAKHRNLKIPKELTNVAILI